MSSPQSSTVRRLAVAALLGANAAAAGCDPVVDVAGSFFPSWMLCLLVGSAFAALLRLPLARFGLEPHLGPLPIVYGCLAALLTMTTWLVFFAS